MKIIYRITFLILISFIYAGCQREKGCSEEPSQTFYHNIDPYYKELVPFGKPGFTMELTDSSTGQKVKFTFNGMDSGYWKEVNQGLNPINCPKSDYDAYQYYNYNCVSSNDSLLRIEATFHRLWRDLTGVSNNLQPNVGLLKLDDFYYPFYPERSLNIAHPSFIQKITINGYSYDSVLVINRNWFENKNQIFYNFKRGIVVLRTKNQLWQQE